MRPNRSGARLVLAVLGGDAQRVVGPAVDGGERRRGVQVIGQVAADVGGAPAPRAGPPASSAASRQRARRASARVRSPAVHSQSER